MNDPSLIINGERWHKYFSEYRFGDATFSIHIWARTDEEAIERLRAVRRECIEATRIRGVLEPHAPLASWRVRFACWWRNLFGIK